MEEKLNTLDSQVSEVVRCTYCAELAVGVNFSGYPVCGIAENHPGIDNIAVDVVEA